MLCLRFPNPSRGAPGCEDDEQTVDGLRFDNLTRALGLRSRREMLASLGMVVLGDLLGHTTDTLAARRKKHRSALHRGREREQLHTERKRKRKHNKKHRKARSVPPAGSPPASPPPQTSPPPVPPVPPIPPTPPCSPRCAATNPCGDDGCGGSCGTCAANETCRGGRCVCDPDCTGKAMWS